MYGGGLRWLLTVLLVLGLRVEAETQGFLFVPDTPPLAALIQVSAPNAVGDVTVVGAPGAVPGQSSVMLVTLDTGHFAHTQAAADGSFSASLFAPTGTSILVKADPGGVILRKALDEIQLGGEGALAAAPGTIVRVADPAASAAGIPFGGAGLAEFGQIRLPAWTFQGTLSPQTLEAGGTLRVQGTLEITSRALQAAGTMRVGAQLTLEQLAGPDGLGSQARNFFSSVFVTPTGFPIERAPQNNNEGLDQGGQLDFPKVAPDRATTTVDLSLRIPGDLLAGFYRPFIRFFFDGVPTESPPSRPIIGIDKLSRRPYNGMYLPIVRVGSPAPSRLFWTLLTDTLSNGTRGIRAREDQGRFGIASRILTQSETFIVPRIDATTGRPLRYRLEPFALTVTVGDRGVAPHPPLIPFRFPSGSLTVRVQKPNGSLDVFGPAPLVQGRVKSLVDRVGNTLDIGGGHITDAYELSTVDPRFEVQFTQDGLHVITLEGTIEDIWGNTWTGGGTYEVHVARLLSLDTAVLPMMQFEVGDVFTPGLVLTPSVPADVEVRFRLAPNSDASRMVERVVRGRANRFGYFHPLASGILLDQPGEYRVDATASFRDERGELWMGARTWAGVVAPRNPEIIAHGRRGIDSLKTVGPQWFSRSQTSPTIPSDHVPFAFNSGDIMWQQKSDATIPLIAIQDPAGPLANLLRARALDPAGGNRAPLIASGTFDERLAVGELPLFSSRPDGLDPHLDPSRVDLWGYSYRSVQRPLVRVREEVTEDQVPSLYWRFSEQYAAQIGVGRNGDLPNDIKFQYGGVVLRGSALPTPHYAIYGSLFVLVPDNDPRGGSRTFPPFQGNGGGPSGGPIMTLKGREIDLFIHLTGVRPGSVLEVGDTFALSGAIGPTHPALVSYTVTKPDGERLSFSGRANRVGYYYRPEHDFLVDQPGLYTVDLRVTFDGVISAGQVTAPFPTGDVLGTANGRFFLYVVRRDSRPLDVPLPRTAFLPPPAGLDVSASVPAGLLPNRAHVTAMMPGFVLESRDLPPSSTLAYRYDPVSLARDFPNLDVEFRGQPDAADATTLSLFASGTTPEGAPAHAARVLALHGPELLNLPLPAALSPQLAVTTDRTSYDRTQPLTLSAHFAQGSTTALADVYLGLLRPDGTFASVLLQDGQFTLIPTGGAPAPLLRNSPLRLDFSAPVLTHPWAPADPAGSYTAFAVLVRAGQDPFNRANWLAVGTTSFTLSL